MIRKLAMGALVILMVSLFDACAATQQQPTGTEGAKNEGHSESSNAASSPAHPSGGQIGNSEEPSDPFEHFNESMLTFNRKADDWVLRPAATGYAYVLPQPARASVGRFFQNVGVIPRFANDLFQGQFRQAGVETARFGINSTVGVAGLFDPADKWFGLKQEPNDFGLTLAKYGVKEGPYLMLPILGPSTVRDAFGKVVDGAMNPVAYTAPSSAILYEMAANAVAAVNARSENLNMFDDVDLYSIDPYGAIQDAYLERRQQQEDRVRSGE
jgi:phospholipid-binding lipoprotein MlaA